jgi:hypothetical protein
MFRFTIRDLLWLMVVVGLALAWRADRVNIRREWRTQVHELARDLASAWGQGITVSNRYGTYRVHALLEPNQEPPP